MKQFGRFVVLRTLIESNALYHSLPHKSNVPPTTSMGLWVVEIKERETKALTHWTLLTAETMRSVFLVRKGAGSAPAKF